jgi:hypothetical protein
MHTFKSQGVMPVRAETLATLANVLQAAFRMHCTGETLAGRAPWQLVCDVQQKLRELCPGPPALISDERLADYIEALAGPASPAAPVIRLEDAA